MEPSDQELDSTVMSRVSTEWQKVAMIIGRSLKPPQMEVAERLAARIEHLVRTGQLESQGNLSDWRHSEIRLAKRKR
jgi:hypothetical protein